MGRYGIIGSINRDTIVGADGSVRQDLGGVLYTVLALTRLLPEATVLPLARVGADAMPAIRALLAGYPRVRCEGLREDPGTNWACLLQYRPDGSKQETLSGWLPPLAAADLLPAAAGLDALLVNFITGTELDLATLRGVRACLRGPVAMDLHSLLLATAPGGARRPAVPPDWQMWVAQADALQMNESEAALLADLGDHPAPAALAAFGRRLLGLGPRWVVITRGAAGALAVNAGGQQVLVPAFAGAPAVDPTGCGDVFLAALGAGLAAGTGLEHAVRRACRAAGQACGLAGPAALAALTPLDAG